MPTLDLLTFSWHIVAALAMGLAIGLERQLQHHPAGLRTNALVCTGAALFVSLSLLMQETSTPTRMASYIISGIGFLAGGVILREGLNVRGMNTAATMWCSAAVGTLVGSGFPIHGLIGTITVLVVHIGLRPLDRWLDSHSRAAKNVEMSYQVRLVCDADQEGTIRTILLRHVNTCPKMTVLGISTKEADHHESKQIVADIHAIERLDHEMQEVVSRMTIEPGVRSVSWRKSDPIGG